MIRNYQHGITYVELLLALTIAALLIAGLTGVTGEALQIGSDVGERNRLTREARFAMQRMIRAVQETHLLLLPLTDNPASNWPENIREQTVPPSTPVGDSTQSTAVLAVTLSRIIDLDNDGTADADNDGDRLYDEDPPADRTNDAAPGIYLIDDDGDGTVDEGSNDDDDESGAATDEDPADDIDNDDDGSLDEDPGADMNADGCPGICGIDDDSDGTVDEGNAEDDDEDGSANEDGYDPVVFYLEGDALMERTPVPWDESGSGGITGRDFIVSPIAGNVTRFRVERIARGDDRIPTLDITLELTGQDTGEIVRLQARVRVGRTL